jgi:hypothetical protein
MHIQEARQTRPLTFTLVGVRGDPCRKACQLAGAITTEQSNLGDFPRPFDQTETQQQTWGFLELQARTNGSGGGDKFRKTRCTLFLIEHRAPWLFLGLKPKG